MRNFGLKFADIEIYRKRSFHLLPSSRISNEKEALQFVIEAGFALLLAPKDQLDFPVLSSAYPPERTDWKWWDWKQTLPARKACYYAKVLRCRGTFISWECFPWFYAVYASREPYEREWREGLLERTHKRLLDILSINGQMMTKELRLAYGAPNKQNTRLVKQALVALQRSFRVCPCGGDTEGWSHHCWDLVERWVSRKYLRKANTLSASEAGAAIIRRYLTSVGLSSASDISWLFSWERKSTENFLQNVPGLVDVELEDLEGTFLTTKTILRKLKSI